jgi:integrase
MSRELFTKAGKRKYLTAGELDKFISCANQQPRPEIRSFCLVMAWTGCRISEALDITADSVDLNEKTVIFKTLKQREKIRFRAVPVPDSTLDTLELVHHVRKTQGGKRKPVKLWQWGRVQGWKHIKAVMQQAGIKGIQATPKGLRHGFGIRAADKTRNPRLVQKWLGHTSLETTIIYMDAIGQEEREAAAKMWD